MTPYTLSALTTLGASLMLLILAVNVGRNRKKFKVQPYAETKQQEILIAVRVHMNMLENIVLYVPVLWIATIFGPSLIAGILGSIWLLSRIIYTFMYLGDPNKRYIPFFIGLLCIIGTLLLGIYGILFVS